MWLLAPIVPLALAHPPVHLRYAVADDGAPNSPEACRASGGWSGCCAESLPAGYCREAVQAAFANWAATPCFEGTSEDAGVCSNLDPANEPGTVYFLYDTDLAEAGVLAVTYTTSYGPPPWEGGTAWTAQVILQDPGAFVTTDDVRAGRCEGQYSLEAFYTRELSYLFTGTFWSEGGGACDLSALEVAPALVEPDLGLACHPEGSSDDVLGVAPFDLGCVLTGELDEVTEATWTFGDGGTAAGLAVEHTYERPGSYTVRVAAHGERDSCGPDGWDGEATSETRIRVCGPPEPRFELERDGDLRYRLLNESALQEAGCLSALRWEVFHATSGARVFESPHWEPELELPEPGRYTVVLTVGGLAGEAAARVVLDTRPAPAGCDTTGGRGGLLALALVASLNRVRRPRTAPARPPRRR